MRFRGALTTVLGAVILSTGFAPLGLWFSAPISYALYLKVLERDKNLLFNSFLFGFVANAIILSWSKTFVGVLPWILLSALQGLYLIPVGFLARYVKKPLVLLFAIFLMDEAKGYLPFGGFGWTRIAFSQVDSPLISWVSVIGVTGMSLLTLLISLAMTYPREYFIAPVLILLIAAPFLLSESSSTDSVKVRAVQGGVPERGLSFNARAQAVLDNHIAVTLRDFEDSDELIIWPENAIDVDPIRTESARAKIEDLEKVIEIPLLAGAILNADELSNASILFSESAAAQSIYIKRYLTPFGEYIPLRSLASKLSEHVERVSDFTPGEGYVYHAINNVKVSSVICYEILSDRIFREGATNSGLIAVLTNSATFAGSSEGEQQMAITRIRAIENGRNIVSVSTTGPSAFIDYRGDIIQRLGDGEVGSISMEMRARKGNTLAAQYGGFLSGAAILFALIFIGREFVGRRRR